MRATIASHNVDFINETEMSSFSLHIYINDNNGLKSLNDESVTSMPTVRRPTMRHRQIKRIDSRGCYHVIQGQKC